MNVNTPDESKGGTRYYYRANLRGALTQGNAVARNEEFADWGFHFAVANLVMVGRHILGQVVIPGEHDANVGVAQTGGTSGFRFVQSTRGLYVPICGDRGRDRYVRRGVDEK